MTTLTKSVSLTYVPGTPGSPGSPGTPATPAYYSTEFHAAHAPFGVVAGVTYGQVDIPGGGYVWTSAPGLTFTIFHPATPGSPAIAPTPATPSSFLTDFNLGWTGRASSIATLPADGSFVFSILATNIGAVVGLSSAPAAIGYSDILYGFYSSHGVAQIYESGVSVYTYGAHVTTDLFKVRRRGGMVDYLVNGTVVYTSAQPPNNATMFLTAALYSGGDSVIGALLTGENVGVASFLPVAASGYYTGYSAANGYDSLYAMTGSAYANTTTSFVSMQPLDSVGGINIAQDSVVLQPLSGIGTGIPIPAFALTRNSFSFLESTSTGTTGGLATNLLSNMMPLDSYATQGIHAQAIDSMQSFTSVGSQDAPGTGFMLNFSSMIASMDGQVNVYLVVASSGVVTGIMTVQTVMDGAVPATATIGYTFSGQLTIQALMTAIASIANINFDDGVPTIWALNTKNAGTTRYSNFGFNSFAKIGANFYGVKKDGLYKLTGASDNGTAIAAAVNFGKHDFGSSKLKAMENCYVGVASNGAVVLKVVTDGNTYYYTARRSSTNLDTQRIDLGRGLRANFFELELQNSNGGAFELATIEFTPLQLSRRI